MTEQTDDRIERALDDLCRLDDEFGLTPEDVRWVRERAQTIRAARAAAGAATGNSAFPVADDTVERAARALAALDHTEDWSGRGNYDDLAEWEQVAAKDAARVALAAAGAGAEVDREAQEVRLRDLLAVFTGYHSWTDEFVRAVLGSSQFATRATATPTVTAERAARARADKTGAARGGDKWAYTYLNALGIDLTRGDAR